MAQLHQAFTIFLSLLVEAIPFLTIGVLLSSVLLIFADEKKLVAFLPRQPFLGAIAGSFLGFLFPVCECGNVPVARRLLLQGLPTSVAVAFLLAAPTLNPIVIWSTWAAFRQPNIVIARVIFSLIITLIISYLFSLQSDLVPILQPRLAQQLQRFSSAPSSQPSLLAPGTYLLGQPGSRLEDALLSSPLPVALMPNRWQVFLDNVLQELRELGGMLILGSAIAAIIQVFVPRDIILTLGQGTFTSILAMMLLAAVVSVCSTVDSFFALSFAATFTTSSLLAFLVLGPMIDIKSVGLMLSIFRGKIIFYLLVLVAQLTLVLSVIYSFVF